MNTRRTIFAAAGILGLVAAVVIAAAGWWLAGRANATLGRTLAVAADGVAVAGDTVSLAGETLDELAAGLAALEAGLTTTGSAFAELPPVVDELSALAAVEIPAGLEGVAGTAAALGDVARALEQALAPLRILGVEAAPVGGLTESLTEVEASLAGVPQRLRAQAAGLRRAADGLTAVDGDVQELVARVRDTRLGLGDAAALVDRYLQTTADADAVVAGATADLDRQVLAGRLLAIVLGAAIALLQVVPLSLAFTPDHRLRSGAERAAEEPLAA